MKSPVCKLSNPFLYLGKNIFRWGDMKLIRTG